MSNLGFPCSFGVSSLVFLPWVQIFVEQCRSEGFRPNGVFFPGCARERGSDTWRNRFFVCRFFSEASVPENNDRRKIIFRWSLFSDDQVKFSDDQLKFSDNHTFPTIMFFPPEIGS